MLAFSDGVYAIAMTLLVVGIGLPALTNESDQGELLRDLGDLAPEAFSFFLSFAVIGRYWLAHHEFFARLGAVNTGFIRLHLLYLGFVAFLPFPTDLLGNYFENAVAAALYALAVAIVSGLEVVLFRYACRHGLLIRELPDPVYRWVLLASSSPVIFFLVSIPVAFLSTTAAVACWFLFVPFQMLVVRPRKPAGADELI